MRVLLLEDEPLTALRLADQLYQYDPTIQVLATLSSVAKAVAWLHANPAPDLLLLDIHLEDDSVFRLFEDVPVRIPVIFTTAYDQYLLQAFQVHSIDYLLKPIAYHQLAAALNKYRELRAHFASPADLTALLKLVARPAEPTYRERFMVSIGPQLRSIEVAAIAYFFLEERTTWLTTHQGATLPLEYSLDKLTQQLNPRQFFRVSRQYLVHLTAIDTVHTYSAGRLKLTLRPAPRHEVFVSSDRLADFKEWLGK
jgi:DNA-binding LytR/AlgR family response regulator